MGSWQARQNERDGVRAATVAEALADAGERFDLVLAMEVVEHVADVGLMVARGYRRRGVGLALMERAEEWAQEVGVLKIELHVFPHNEPAIELYERSEQASETALTYRALGALFDERGDTAAASDASGFSREDSVREKLAKLEAVLAHSNATEEEVALVAALALSLWAYRIAIPPLPARARRLLPLDRLTRAPSSRDQPLVARDTPYSSQQAVPRPGRAEPRPC